MTRGCSRVEGGKRLSAKKRSEREGADNHARSAKPAASEGKSRKTRTGDIGRALRSVYDDTLRETVPDDLAGLLGKLS